MTAHAAMTATLEVGVTRWGGQRRRGQAPRGKLERRIEAWMSGVSGGGKGKGKGKGKTDDLDQDHYTAMSEG